MSAWSIHLAWSGATDSELLSDIAEALAKYHCAIATDYENNCTSAQLTLEAPALQEAVNLALAATLAAVENTGAKCILVRLEVLEEAAFQIELYSIAY